MHIPPRARAFTLIETMVAIAIFTLAIVGPFVAASRALTAAAVARDGLMASGLAQEGLEIVRAERDQAYLAHQSDPLAYLGACIAPGRCVADMSTLAASACSSSCPALYVTGSGLYNQSGSGAPSLFTRTISVARNPGGLANAERATVTVTWTDHGAHTLTLTEDFYDWL